MSLQTLVIFPRPSPPSQAQTHTPYQTADAAAPDTQETPLPSSCFGGYRIEWTATKQMSWV